MRAKPSNKDFRNSTNMDYKYIEQLLERYWACETTLEEEEILRAFFCQTEVPAHLQRYRSLFVYEHEEKRMEVLGEDFDQKILSMVDEKPVFVLLSFMF